MFKKLSEYLILSIFCFLLILFSGAISYAQEYNGSLPETFNEAPEFQEMVEAGELPSVTERLPKKEDTYVVEPNEGIGNYGGVIDTTTLQAENYGDDTILMSWPNPVKPVSGGEEIVPHVLKKLESSEDKSTYTFHLREGLKWSDGEPFTAEDIMFWYNDVLLNEDLTPAVGPPWKVEGEIVDVSKIDQYTVKFDFPVPRPYFKNSLVHTGAWNLFFPKHYLSQFHPNYVNESELSKKVEEAGFDQWYELFEDKNRNIWGQPITVDRPTLTSYVLEKKTSSRRIYKRNPYYWKVDPEGNQLPYIDKIETDVVSDVEVAQGKILSGEVDFACMQTDVRNYPMYRNYEEEGDFKTVLWESGMGSDVIYMVNMTSEDPELREVFQKAKFRRALSLGIDREEIIETIYFGHGKPRQYTVLESSPFYESEFANAYTEYNPTKAKELLDEIGLDEKDSEGYRITSEGNRLSFTIEYVESETPKTPNVELVAEHWEELGLDIEFKTISGELSYQKAPANLIDAYLWHGDEAGLLFPSGNKFLYPAETRNEKVIFPKWTQWFQSEGESGEEPPSQIKKLYDWWEQLLIEPSESKRSELGKKILEFQAENLLVIGTVGNTPYPIILNSSIGNFPEEGYAVWDTIWTSTKDPEQFYFKKD